MPTLVDGRGCLECHVDGFKIKFGFPRTENRWISCVCRGHGNGECGMEPPNEPVELMKDDCLQGYIGA